MVDDQHRSDAQLLTNIKRDLRALTALADQVKGHWAEEDMVYRFWHRSFKVYGIQDLTLRVFLTGDQTNFFRPIMKPSSRIEARVVNVSKTLITAEADFLNADGKLAVRMGAVQVRRKAG